MAKPYAVGFFSAIAAASGFSNHHAFSDSPPPSDDPETPPPPPKFRNNNPRTTSAGFDPEPLVKGAKTLHDIATSPHGKNVGFLFPSHSSIHTLLLFYLFILISLSFFFFFLLLKVFENIKKREDEKQAEFAAKVAESNQIRAQHEAVSLFILVKPYFMYFLFYSMFLILVCFWFCFDKN